MSNHHALNRDTWIGRRRNLLMFGVPLVAAAIALAFYLHGGRYVSTDDAYVCAARVAISADISGRVMRVPLRDNQLVHRGDLLLQIDERPFVLAVQEAQAQLAAARLQVRAMKAGYQQRLADMRAARSTLTYRQQEYNRQKTLAASGIASQSQLDQARQQLQTAQQEVAARQQNADNALANLDGNPTIEVNAHPSVQAAQAKLDLAKLNLSYTRVLAPMDGVVTKVEQLQPGDYITKGAALFALVSTNDYWVEANFKETALAHMRPGQTASISVDAHSGKSVSGKVASLSPGTGSSFALLPPENATGNWVKVVQRVPVRIQLNANTQPLPLQSGLSVTATVDTGITHLQHLLSR